MSLLSHKNCLTLLVVIAVFWGASSSAFAQSAQQGQPTAAKTQAEDQPGSPGTHGVSSFYEPMNNGPRFIDNQDGTVTDNRTGLIWLKGAGCLGEQTWKGAHELVRELQDGHLCKGFTLRDGSLPGDWRLPTIREIMTLPVSDHFNPALSNTKGDGKWREGDPFTNVSPLYYWSSTSIDGGNAWYMYLYNGVLGISDQNGYANAWPVKGRLLSIRSAAK